MTTLSDQGEKISTLKPCRRSLIAVSLMHFVNDLHPTFLPAFLPALVKSLSLSLTQAGALNALFGIINLFGQPLAGHLADRQKKPYFTLWAPLFTAAGACLLPVSPSYGTALLFVTVLALGTSAFHPQGHGLTGIAGGETHLATYLSIFGAAGSMGAAFSPLYAVFLAKTIGIHAIPFTLIPIAGIAFIASLLLPKTCITASTKTKKTIAGDAFIPNLLATFKTCKNLMMISIVRDSTSQGIRLYPPADHRQRRKHSGGRRNALCLYHCGNARKSRWRQTRRSLWQNASDPHTVGHCSAGSFSGNPHERNALHPPLYRRGGIIGSKQPCDRRHGTGTGSGVSKCCQLPCHGSRLGHRQSGGPPHRPPCGQNKSNLILKRRLSSAVDHYPLFSSTQTIQAKNRLTHSPLSPTNLKPL